MPLLPVPEFTSFLGLTAGRLPVAAGPASIVNSNFTAAANVIDLAASGVMSIGPTNATQTLFGGNQTVTSGTGASSPSFVWTNNGKHVMEWWVGVFELPAYGTTGIGLNPISPLDGTTYLGGINFTDKETSFWAPPQSYVAQETFNTPSSVVPAADNVLWVGRNYTGGNYSIWGRTWFTPTAIETDFFHPSGGTSDPHTNNTTHPGMYFGNAVVDETDMWSVVGAGGTQANLALLSDGTARFDLGVAGTTSVNFTSTGLILVPSGQGIDSSAAGSTLNLGTNNAGAINVGNSTNTSTVITTAPSYTMFFTPSFYLNAAANATLGSPTVNSPNSILRGKYFSGGTSNTIDSYFYNQVTNAVGPASQVNLIVQGVSYIFQSNGNLLVPAGCDFDTSTSGQLNIGITAATGISMGYVQTVQTLVQSKNITLKGTDTANATTPVVTDTINAYTGTSAIVSFRNAGSQKAAIDASGSLYMSAGQQLDALSAGSLGIGLSNANNITIGHNNGGPIQLNYGGTGGVVLTQGAGSGTPGNAFTLAAGAHTALTAGTENTDFFLSLNRVVQFNTGSITTQRAVRIDAPAYAFVGASTITNAATFAITGAPILGTNATIVNNYAFWVQAGAARFDGDAQISHAVNGTAAPTVSSITAPQLGTSPTVTLEAGSGDMAGCIKLTTGTAPSASGGSGFYTLCILTWTRTFGTTPSCVLLYPASSITAQLMLGGATGLVPVADRSSMSATAATISLAAGTTGVTLAAGTVYRWNYIVIK